MALGAHVVVGAGSGTTATTASRTSTGGANTVFSVYVSWYGSATAPTVTDSKGNTYSQVGSTVSFSDDTNLKGALFECLGGTGGASHTWTATFAGTQDLISAWVQEWVFASGTATRDQAPAGVSDSSSPFTSGSATTTQANEALLSYVTVIAEHFFDVVTWGNSFTSNGDWILGDELIWGDSAYREVSSTGTYNSSLTLENGFAALVFLVTYYANVDGGEVYDAGEDDSISVSDSVSTDLVKNVSVSDSISVSDSVSILEQRSLSVVEIVKERYYF